MNNAREDSSQGCTRRELEEFLDGALAGDRASEVSALLRSDPALRERLARVSHLDALARVALMTPAPAARRSGWGRMGVVLVAACLVMAGAVMYRTMPRVAPKGDDGAGRVAAAASQATDRLVVLSFPVPVRDEQETEEGPGPDAASPAPEPTTVARAGGPEGARAKEFTGRLDAALARGDAAGAAAMLDAAGPELRAAGYKRLAGALRSVTTAERVLRGLPAPERLAACRELAAEPRWRSVTCTELRGLHTDETMRPAVERLLEEFGRSPALAPLAERVRQADRSL
jgi:hypothetical protein